MDGEEQATEGLHFVGKKDQLIEEKRSFRTLEGRDILIIHQQGAFYALDSYCYHAGGALQNGDIEDIDGKTCIICPKHKYKICLANGESLYKATDPTQDPPAPRWYSKGVKQRTHMVTETNGDVYVKLSYNPGWVESDFYQGEKGKVERAKAEAADKATS
ncbi:Rieske domain-containing protein-like [Salarias fasciatus]|uniref:Rieske domain-containing protein n=1 Tax=Salarias fasciatus TaxID=181472 RepID=A0A672FPG3_SALFA|nr:Rieske domain-containing protein-like [Salarias fasciatus]XP_029943979.1 Rieske domain-containing protein-like [Salarias fasciatus]XP_029943980.1 Rieske domain-containing protein-like [Salarias fasciatus]